VLSARLGPEGTGGRGGERKEKGGGKRGEAVGLVTTGMPPDREAVLLRRYLRAEKEREEKGRPFRMWTVKKKENLPAFS